MWAHTEAQKVIMMSHYVGSISLGDSMHSQSIVS